MGFILLSLLQFVGRAFYYYYCLVGEEINTSARIVSRFCSVTDRQRFSWESLSQHLGCSVLQSSVPKCLQNQQTLAVSESPRLRLCGFPSLWGLLLPLAAGVIVGALLFQVVRWSINKGYGSSLLQRDAAHYYRFPEIFRQICQNRIQN